MNENAHIDSPLCGCALCQQISYLDYEDTAQGWSALRVSSPAEPDSSAPPADDPR